MSPPGSRRRTPDPERGAGAPSRHRPESALTPVSVRQPGDAGDPSGVAFRVAIEVWIPSDIGYIERVVEIVRRQVAEMSFDVRHVMLNVPVALTEALSNAILRGNADDPSKHVHVRASVTARQLVMEVKDEGPGFDIERCTRDPTRPENVEREDGRGLFLMRSLMDSVERYDEQGNVVRLTLNRR